MPLKGFFRLIKIYKRKETRTKREGGHGPKPYQANKLSKKLGAKRQTQQRVEEKIKKKQGNQKEKKNSKK